MAKKFLAILFGRLILDCLPSVARNHDIVPVLLRQGSGGQHPKWMGKELIWAEFKRVEIGRKGTASDEDYFKFLNGQDSEPEPDWGTL